MNYPFWETGNISAGMLIAVISVLHVYIAHLAVGGGLFLVWTERKARREKNVPLLDYVRSHTWFFLLLTMVLGGMTGVGIWFIISLTHPAGTSALIHNFVFGWAIEWVFFIVEIVSLLIYHYMFDRLKPKVHMAIGWVYAVAAWLSLFVINGILSFMLTPGQWTQTGNFWAGFFNPGFLPSLIFRTAAALMIAGLFGLITAVFMKNNSLKRILYKYCARWMIVPFIVIVLSAVWYAGVIPGDALDNLRQYNPSAKLYITAFITGSVILFLGGLILLFTMPQSVYKPVTAMLVLVGLAWLGAFEFLREIARKPYIIYDFMYSTSVSVKDRERIDAEGFLANAKWSSVHKADEGNLKAAGRELFRHQCQICHTAGGNNDILTKTAKFGIFGMKAQLTGQGKINSYMPPFMGSEREKEALASYIVDVLHVKKSEPEEAYVPKQESYEQPEFDLLQDKYLLFAWNDLGMHCISDNDKYFVIRPPANTLNAQLIRRGEKPEIVTTGVEISYEVQDGYRHPEKHVAFWKYAAATFGKKLSPGSGLTGKNTKGILDLASEPQSPVAPDNFFAAHAVPVVPYKDDGSYNPYPLFTITAKDSQTGEVLAETKTVAPVSTEMGCRNCHGGGWRFGNISGISDETAVDILKVHDRTNGTELLAEAIKGRPKRCRNCHEAPVLGATGKPGILNLSAAMHGFHAGYLTGMESEACNACHPSHTEGKTRFSRGVHSQMYITCVECHGVMEDHALSLLLYEKRRRKSSADRLMKNLTPVNVDRVEQIIPRKPWHNEPDCLSCHKNFSGDVYEIDGFNKWVKCPSSLFRNRTDPRGIMCAACHGPPHVIYPALNPYGDDRDNIQPLQYQNNTNVVGYDNNCALCHTKDMNQNAHHPGTLRR